MRTIDINSIRSYTLEKELHKTEAALMQAIKRKKRRYCLMGCCIVIIPIAACIWSFYQSKKDLQAQKDCFQAIYHFESAAFDKALEGDGTHKGFLTIIKEYPYTPTARLMHLYAGFSYMHKKVYDQAISFLKKFDCQDFIVQARAYAVIADAYSEQKNYTQAAFYYKKAASYKPNSVYTPHYLVKAAIAFEENNRYKEAYSCYSEIVKNYPHAELYQELALKEGGRLSALLAN